MKKSLPSARSLSNIEKEIQRRADPEPIVVEPSQEWDGNDGLWSSFTFQIGNPPQYIRLLPSTSSLQTLIPAPGGCPPTAPPNCSLTRGSLFNESLSTTYSPNKASTISSVYPLNIALPYLKTLNLKALLGFDDIAFGFKGSGGVTIKNQTVGGFFAKEVWLGVVGLCPRSNNFSSFEGVGGGVESLVMGLKRERKIPSLSWGYSAGNRYRNNRVLGSLTLGGYDESKFYTNDVRFKFHPEDIRDLTVNLDAITYNLTTSSGSSSRKEVQSETSKHLLQSPIPVFLDSSTPYIHLPLSACLAFEQAFNLTYHNSSQLYLLDENQHSSLLAVNPTITFHLKDPVTNVTIPIALPYSAFDLEVSYPLVAGEGKENWDTKSRYFPLKRTDDESQHALGRVWFQEAYVVADYERSQFMVAQSRWDAGVKKSIVPIKPVAWDDETTSGVTSKKTETSSSRSSGYTAGIIGGTLGGLLAVLTVAALMYYLYVRPRRLAAKAAEFSKPDETTTSPSSMKNDDILQFKPELDATQVVHEMEEHFKSQWIVETDGQPVAVYELPTTEDVTGELWGHGNAAELVTLGNSAEVEDTGVNRDRFSWMHTPIEEEPGSEVQWREVESTDTATEEVESLPGAEGHLRDRWVRAQGEQNH